MFLELKGLLNAGEVARLKALGRELKFVDGRLSNPVNKTKHNLQADLADPRYAESVKVVAGGFARSREFKDFAIPRRVAPPLLCRYEVGMKYGAHADSAHMQSGNAMFQSDLSATIFISDPKEYEGGELVIHLGTRPVVFKGAPGDAIIYPSTLLHEVRPVTAGTRLVSITFIESLVADQYKRTQLYELGEVFALEGDNMKWENRIRLETIQQNLLRLWSRI
jgi:PKHD-type hydroxylase